MDYAKESLKLHYELKGKIEITCPKCGRCFRKRT